MTVLEFTAKHGVSKNNIYVQKGSGRLPDEAFESKNKRDLRINESWFVRRKDFQTKMYQNNYNMYYIISEHMNDTEISKYLSSKTGTTMHNWRAWLGQRFWSGGSNTITRYRISRMHWTFNKYARQLIRRTEWKKQ